VVSPVSRIRVLVVDDSVVVRRLVSDILAGDARLEVVGTAANGKVALAKIPQVNPDLITLDVEMPVMDGLETVREIRKLHPKLPVIMFSTLTERGATVTLDALEGGANDYVAKPANVGSVTASMEAVRRQLIPKILALCARSVPVAPSLPPLAARPTAAAGLRSGPPGRVDILAIGASTGGPDALTRVLGALPASLPVPVVVVQHMPPVFTQQFAERLDTRCPLRVHEAVAGTPLKAGHVLIAPGDWHLRVKATGAGVTARLDQGTPENYCRPAVDVLFRSVAETYGGRVLAVVLTGMGSDGARGSAEIVRAGGSVLVQDEATSVVWGMPGAVATAGLASAQLPLGDVAPAILTRIAAGRPSFVSTRSTNPGSSTVSTGSGGSTVSTSAMGSGSTALARPAAATPPRAALTTWRDRSTATRPVFGASRERTTP
jgi:two-component system chemotaxis response regulator CheB